MNFLVFIIIIFFQFVAMKFILKHGKSEKDLHNLRQEIEVLTKIEDNKFEGVGVAARDILLSKLGSSFILCGFFIIV